MPEFAGLPLHTTRLCLRPLQHADADALFALFADAAAMQYWSTPPWATRQQAIDTIERDHSALQRGTALRLALQPHAAPAIVGTVSLFAFDAQSGRAEIGYMLARAAWGAGVMHEALQALLAYAFGTLGLRRLEADIDPRNERSARCLLRLGFVQEGLLRERWVVAGQVSDSALFGLLVHQWQPRGRHVDAP